MSFKGNVDNTCASFIQTTCVLGSIFMSYILRMEKKTLDDLLIVCVCVCVSDKGLFISWSIYYVCSGGIYRIPFTLIWKAWYKYMSLLSPLLLVRIHLDGCLVFIFYFLFSYKFLVYMVLFHSQPHTSFGFFKHQLVPPHLLRITLSTPLHSFIPLDPDPIVNSWVQIMLLTNSNYSLNLEILWSWTLMTIYPKIAQFWSSLEVDPSATPP